MLKKEIIYRHIISEALEHRQFSFTQLAISRKFGFSLSTVNNALKPLEAIGAIEKRARSFALTDMRKLLAYWATARKLPKDIVFSTRSGLGVMKMEGQMPAGVAFTAYSGYRLAFNDAPADYGAVYVYADETGLEEIRGRFPEAKGPANLFVLKKDDCMPAGNIAPHAQIYVDLWCLKEWQAKDFLDALERRLLK